MNREAPARKAGLCPILSTYLAALAAVTETLRLLPIGSAALTTVAPWSSHRQSKESFGLLFAGAQDNETLCGHFPPLPIRQSYLRTLAERCSAEENGNMMRERSRQKLRLIKSASRRRFGCETAASNRNRLCSGRKDIR
jgi:hypothetical protein